MNKPNQTTTPTGSEQPNHGLETLIVFDALEIGPVKLETRRLTAPYKLVIGDRVEQTELIYTYEEDVFEPRDLASQNLASMIAAQVALNYGLFCKEIIFHGCFDQTDRVMLKQMAENTAREIYVIKFLQPNPFLQGPAANLPVIKQKSYLQAAFSFPDDVTFEGKHAWQYWKTSRHHHAILSSGGKDSLLSYGLIKELGHETHPIFVNESGRHWFTALNAYRHLKNADPLTTKVWTNCDRVFSWMLRHMPFIRPNFADMRSDEYPIRLWTVAVFLFGVLPLLRKREIGRILIGDEYDTSRRLNYQGIPHYDGLFDQSRYFDNALSRFFMKKGWGIRQFSILRPLSEMLIQKILVERYPQLQAHQTSCHATHSEGERILPCGKCEKCRRIVGMLKAIDADPRACGYPSSKIANCLMELASKGVHQEEAGIQFLFHRLREKNLIPGSDKIAKKAPKTPDEILKTRFDHERSPMTDLPVDLREPLYRIFKEHAAGHVTRKNRKWVSFDPLHAPEITHPYPFEMSPNTSKQGRGNPNKQATYLWGEMTWKDTEQRLKQVDVALLPVGAIEQHGPHLPLDVDAFDAEYQCHRVAEACSEPRPLVLPLIPYGVSYHHDSFSGTISVSNETLSKLVYDIGMSVANHGIRKLVIINGHGGNAPALQYAAQLINRDAHIFVCVDTGETSDVDIDAMITTPNDVHAGETETSTTLAVRPHLVKMEEAKKEIPRFSSKYLSFTAQRGVTWYAYTDKISTSGVMGDPTKATAEKGQIMWEVMTAHIVALIEDLKNMDLKDLYHKRY